MISKLGEIEVDAYTTPCPVCIKDSSDIKKALDIFNEYGFRHLPVVNDAGKLLGLVTQRDIHTVNNFKMIEHISISDLMVKDVETIKSGDLLSDAVFTMSEKKIGSLVVMEPNGEINGIFTSTDALNALIEILREDILT